MTFFAIIKTCLTSKYAQFNGRASRAEYWSFFLFHAVLWFAAAAALGYNTYVLFVENPFVLRACVESNSFNPYCEGKKAFDVSSAIFSLLYWALFAPNLGVTIRRLHDLDRSGWWSALSFLPPLSLILFVMFLFKGKLGLNRFGEDPLERGAKTASLFQ